MTPLRTDAADGQRISNEHLYGLLVVLDGEGADRTVRPSQLPPRPASPADSRPASESEVTHGPELMDWLRRTFD